MRIRLGSMVLLQIDAQRFAILPFKGDAPRAVDVDRIALRQAVQRMEVKPGLPQRRQVLRRLQGVQADDRPLVQISGDPGRSAGLEELFQTTMSEASDHRKCCKVPPNTCQ